MIIRVNLIKALFSDREIKMKKIHSLYWTRRDNMYLINTKTRIKISMVIKNDETKKMKTVVSQSHKLDKWNNYVRCTEQLRNIHNIWLREWYLLKESSTKQEIFFPIWHPYPLYFYYDFCQNFQRRKRGHKYYRKWDTHIINTYMKWILLNNKTQIKILCGKL